MAETFLTPVIEKLVELVIEEATSLKGVQKKVESLQKELEMIEPLLRDAEAKSGRGQLTDATKVWLRQLREESERIEDVIDEYSYYAEQRRQDQSGGFIGSMRKAGHKINSLKTRHHLASEIQEIQDSLERIKDSGLKYGLRPFEQGRSVCREENSRIGSLFLEDGELVGIESEVKELVTTLVAGSPQRTVVSFVGEGGIGKTTLARKVYKDVKEKGFFDVHVWVTVSQSYDIEKILKMLMDEICPSRAQSTFDVEQVLVLLSSSLTEKRYVIVFDDVWQTDFWSVIKHAFPGNSNGSRVLVTTRNASVVESFDSRSWESVVKEVKTWSAEQAWELFCRKAFPISRCPPELENLSREILSKCQGIPLAIVTVAGLLSTKRLCEVEWKRVHENLINCGFEEQRELSSVSKVLSLSYHDLPYHLKMCFLYFGVFPEDTLIKEERLCKIWIAEGFIEWRKDKSMEHIAKEYMTELISRNLVSFEMKFGSDRHCKVHDLILDVIQKRASDLGFYQLFDENKSSFQKKGRRLIIHNTTKNVLESACNLSIRSAVLVNTSDVSNSFVAGLLKKCKLLKVVDFENCPIDKVSGIGSLLHLTYLNLNFTNVKILPKSIEKLHNLQTLDAYGTLVRELPQEINKLHKLRHLFGGSFKTESKYSVNTFIGVRMHEGIGNLVNLEKLNLVEARSGDGGFIKELQKLSKLKSFGISKVGAEMCQVIWESIEKMKDLDDLFLSSINNKEVLNLNCISCPPLCLQSLLLICRLHKMPNWIAKLQNLQTLTLHFSRLVEEPLKCLKDLPKLEYLYMHKAYDGEELQFVEGGFPKLKTLHFRRCKRIMKIKIERGSLPLLTELDIGLSPLMKQIPSDLQNLRILKALRVFDMPKPFVKALQPDGGTEYFKIQHISSVEFWYYTGKGNIYDSYKLGSIELLQHLEK